MNSKQYLSGSEAIRLILSTGMAQSKYDLAKTIGVQPIEIDNYLKNKVVMRAHIAERITFMFDIIITTTYVPAGRGYSL